MDYLTSESSVNYWVESHLCGGSDADAHEGARASGVDDVARAPRGAALRRMTDAALSPS